MNFKIFLLSLVFLGAVTAGYLYMNLQQQKEFETADLPLPKEPPETEITPSDIEPTAPTHRVIRDLPSPGANPVQTDNFDEPPLPPIVEAPKTLDDSDIVVEEAVGDVSEAVAEWLKPDALIQKWVLMVKSAAEGKVIVKNRPVDLKLTPFVVDEVGSIASIGDNNARGEKLIHAITAINPQLLARYYKAWLPLFESAYKQLGESGGFDSRFKQAIDNILNTDPYAAVDAELVRPSVYYRYADEQLEDASELEKSLWRLGPDNTVELQEFLRDVRSAMQN